MREFCNVKRTPLSAVARRTIRARSTRNSDPELDSAVPIEHGVSEYKHGTCSSNRAPIVFRPNARKVYEAG